MENDEQTKEVLQEIDLGTTTSGERRHPRLENPGLDGRLPQRVGAALIDISVTGAGIETEAALDSEAPYRLTLESPGGQLQRSAWLVWNRLAHTTRSAEGDVAPIFRSGLRFEAHTPGAAHDLLEFIRELGPQARINTPPPGSEMNDRSDRIATRFLLNKGFRLSLETEYDCAVRTISLSGLLLETNVQVKPGATLRLQLALPSSQVEVLARVVTVERTTQAQRPRFSAALEFIEISDSGRADLERFLQENLDPNALSSILELPSTASQIALPALSTSQTASPELEPEAPLAQQDAWRLPTVVGLLSLGVLLAGMSGGEIRTLAGDGSWLEGQTGILSWISRVLGVAMVAAGSYLGFRRR